MGTSKTQPEIEVSSFGCHALIGIAAIWTFNTRSTPGQCPSVMAVVLPFWHARHHRRQTARLASSIRRLRPRAACSPAGGTKFVNSNGTPSRSDGQPRQSTATTARTVVQRNSASLQSYAGRCRFAPGVPACIGCGNSKEQCWQRWNIRHPTGKTPRDADYRRFFTRR